MHVQRDADFFCRTFLKSYYSLIYVTCTLKVLNNSVYVLKCGEFVILPNVVLCYVNSDYMNGGNNEKRKTTGKMD